MGSRRIVLVMMILIVSNVYGQGARYIERQLLCALDQVPCDAWGSQVKGKYTSNFLKDSNTSIFGNALGIAALPEIIGRGCESCDRQQVNNVRRIARFVQARYPGLWAAIVEKYSNPEPEQQYYEIGADDTIPKQ